MYYFMSMVVVPWITVIQLSVINNKKSICISRAKICTLDKIEIGLDWDGPDWITDLITDSRDDLWPPKMAHSPSSRNQELPATPQNSLNDDFKTHIGHGEHCSDHLVHGSNGANLI